MKKNAWLFVVLALLLIFGLTVQKGEASAQLSIHVQQMMANICQKLGMDAAAVGQAWWNDYKMFRRLAHVAEFFLLGLAAGKVMKKNGILFCAGVSLVDEITKAVIPGKEFDAVDMLFDAVGYWFGTALAAFCSKGFG